MGLLTLFIEAHNFDIFGVTESLLNESIPTSLLNIQGYSFERKDCGQIGTLSKIKTVSQNKEIIIVRDANSNYLDNKAETPFKELMSLNSFVQTIKSPTCITSHSETYLTLQDVTK